MMVHIYDKHTEQNAFDSNGIAIVNPLSATLVEELNGRYDYELTAVCDPNDDSWRALRVYNIIKSPSTGQLFMIYKVKYSSQQSGYTTITAYANHIWYYLADMFTKHEEGSRSLYWTLVQLFKDLWIYPDGSTYFSHGAGLTEYNFSYDIVGYDPNTDAKYTKFENVSLAYAILGSPDSVVNTWNAELHRDNFYFVISRPKETNNIDFAFEYGVNCTDITFTDDYSDRITELQVFDNYGHFQWVSFVPDAGTFPHQVHVGLQLSYDKDDGDKFHDDYSDYWNNYCHSTQSWEISFVDPAGTDQYAGWSGTDIQIGDICSVRDAVGNYGVQKVVSRKINDVTGRLETIKLGRFVNSAGHLMKYNRIISGDDASYRRIKALENKVNNP